MDERAPFSDVYYRQSLDLARDRSQGDAEDMRRAIAHCDSELGGIDNDLRDNRSNAVERADSQKCHDTLMAFRQVAIERLAAHQAQAIRTWSIQAIGQAKVARSEAQAEQVRDGHQATSG